MDHDNWEAKSQNSTSSAEFSLRDATPVIDREQDCKDYLCTQSKLSATCTAHHASMDRTRLADADARTTPHMDAGRSGGTFIRTRMIMRTGCTSAFMFLDEDNKWCTLIHPGRGVSFFTCENSNVTIHAVPPPFWITQTLPARPLAVSTLIDQTLSECQPAVLEVKSYFDYARMLPPHPHIVDTQMRRKILNMSGGVFKP